MDSHGSCRITSQAYNTIRDGFTNQVYGVLKYVELLFMQDDSTGKVNNTSGTT
jgi:hypothetical protein